jgi:ribosomal protein S27AE
MEVRTMFVFRCPVCDRTYRIRWAAVQTDGSLACWNCAKTRDHRWCPNCRQAKHRKEFEPDRINAERHQWCLDCAAAAKAKPERACEHCGTTFMATRKDARYCCGRCRTTAHRLRG